MIVKYRNRYHDLAKLRREQLLIKKIILHEISESLGRFGFVRTKDGFICEKSLLKVHLRIIGLI